jgi:HK97 family phage portal protein
MEDIAIRAATSASNLKSALSRSFTHLFAQAPRRTQREWLKMATSSPWIAAAERPIAYGLAVALENAKLWTSRSKEKELGPEHELFKFLDSNPYLDIFQIVMLCDTWATMAGEWFWIIERDVPNGPPKQLWPVPPHWVVATPSLGSPFYGIQLIGRGFGGQMLPPVPQSEIIAFKYADPEDPYGRGKGIAEACADEAEADEYAAKHEKNFYWRNAVPGIAIEHPGILEDGQKGLMEKLQQWWESHYGGFWNAFKPAFIGGGMKIHQLSQNAKDSEHIESRTFRRAAIGGVIGTPKLLMGDTGDVNRSTAETSIYIFNSMTLIPHITMFERALNRQLLPQFKPAGAFLELQRPNTSDKEFEHKRNLENMRAGTLRVDEFRRLEGYEEMDGTAYYLVPRNFIAVADLSQIPIASQAPSTLLPAKAEQKALPVVTKMSASEWANRVIGELEEWLTKAADLSESFIAEAVLSGGSNAVIEVGAGIAFDVTNPAVVEFLAERVNRIKTSDESFEATTWQSLKATLVEGYQAGEGTTDLMNRVTNVFDDARGYRSELIARTEMGGAMNGGALQGYLQAGIEKKSWLSALDERTRETHVSAHGRYNAEPIPMTQNFVVGAGSGPAPGLIGLASEDCNCRCSLLPSFDEKAIAYGSPAHIERWDAYCKALDPHEKKFKAELVKAWNERERAILKRLEAEA